MAKLLVIQLVVLTTILTIGSVNADQANEVEDQAALEERQQTEEEEAKELLEQRSQAENEDADEENLEERQQKEDEEANELMEERQQEEKEKVDELLEERQQTENGEENELLEERSQAENEDADEENLEERQQKENEEADEMLEERQQAEKEDEADELLEERKQAEEEEEEEAKKLLEERSQAEDEDADEEVLEKREETENEDKKKVLEERAHHYHGHHHGHHHGHNHGHFRLVNSRGRRVTPRSNQQRALLLFRGGTVCDDYFTMTAAHAICRTMGFPRAVRYTNGLVFGRMQSRKTIRMDDVRCSSTHWSHCTYITRHNCNHREDILLTCLPRFNIRGFRLVNSRGRRIRNHHNHQYGLLLYNGGTVCDDYFSTNSAHAICRLMGFHSASGWTRGWRMRSLQRRKRISLDNVRCRSSTWSSCTYSLTHNCSHVEDIFLYCH